MAAELAFLGSRHLSAIRAFRAQHELLRVSPEEHAPSPFEEQLRRAASELSLPVAELRATVEEWMVRRPGKWIARFRRTALLAEISAYRASGGRTAIVSDYPASAKLAALGAEKQFDCIVSNGEAGGPARLKPWPDGYLAAAERLGVSPHECLVVGDRPDADGEAARRAGMAFRRIS